MSRSPHSLTPADFPAVPGLDALADVAVGPDAGADAVQAIVVTTDGELPDSVGFSRAALSAWGFDAKPGQSLPLHSADGPAVVVVGAGPADALTTAVLRDAAATAVRAAKTAAAVDIHVTPSVDAPADAAHAIVEGALLARYRYTALKSESKHVPLARLGVHIAGLSATDLKDATRRALVTARATVVARDLANTPPGHLTAARLGDVAKDLGATYGFDVELFDKAALVKLRIGGLLGVNQGSAEEPRMIKLTYTPAGKAAGHLGLVGKGIMYDSGGISLKPSDPMHLLMKMDMAGAAAVLGTFTALRDSAVTTKVTGWLMCTDNMPSGAALKLGDVLTTRSGKTIEIKNTDAEGRLAMCDAFTLANEDRVDAVIDIATLTGAALMAFGTATAPVFGNDDAVVDAVLAAASAVDEPVWRMPLEKKYRPQLDSDIADISNLGGKYAGSTTAALFLAEFVGDTPWAHLDIAGTMNAEKDDGWRTTGSTGYGARLLVEFAGTFSR